MGAPYLGDFGIAQPIFLDLTLVDSTGKQTAGTGLSACCMNMRTGTLVYAGVGAVTTSGGLATLTISTSKALSSDHGFITGDDYLAFVGYGLVGAIDITGYPFGRFSISNRAQVTGSANTTQWNGTAVASPATAGIPEVNVKNINNVSAGSVTTVAAVQGTTTAPTFTGSLVKVDVTDIATAAVSATTAQLGVNVVNYNNAAVSTAASGIPKVDIDTIKTNPVVNGGTATFPTNATLASTANITAATGIDVTKVNGSTINNLISGRVDANTQAIATGAIVAGTFGASAIDSSVFAQNAADKVWSTAARTLTSTGGKFVFKKNVAFAAFMFKMVLSSDHVTPATGLTITATCSIDGAAFGACTNAASEISSGWYKIDLAAADLSGNNIALLFTAATADNRDLLIVTQA